ncbi:unnamed protein product [Gordionus sp. m RMFG-2023]|uniref:proteasome subunit beta type-2-like n=1 Tax=Gordionus sp. m RMFG-2023 TaxID=3053472 RepID=UPI0030DE69D7
MECVLGMCFKDFVLLASDATETHSIMVIKHDSLKMYSVNQNVMIGVVGEKGDSHEFAEYVSKNMQLYKFRNGYDVDPFKVAHFARRTLADALRSSSPYYVNSIIAGFDPQTNQSCLFFLDYLASLIPIPFGAQGYGAFFANSILDRHFNKDLNEDDAYLLLTKAIDEIQKRLLVNLPAFKVKIIDKNGQRNLKDIYLKTSFVIDKQST